jgi:hypothetical protein
VHFVDFVPASIAVSLTTRTIYKETYHGKGTAAKKQGSKKTQEGSTASQIILSRSTAACNF